MKMTFSKQVELVLEDGKKSGTHKFAFIRGILDYAIANKIDESRDLDIPLIFIATSHVDYYWKLFLDKIKQVSAGNLPYYGNIEALCESFGVDLKEGRESKLFTLKDKILTGDIDPKGLGAINKIRSKIVEMPAKHAIVMNDISLDYYSIEGKYRAVRGESFEAIYQDEPVFIRIPQKHIRELEQFKSLLSKVTLLHWAAMTDRYTKTIDSGIRYLEDIEDGRSSLKPYLKIFNDCLDIYDCSYCGKAANTIDHVYPWKYARRDEFWNMLPACRSCNSKKSDKVVPISVKNIERLRKFISYILENKKEQFLVEIKYRAVIDRKPIEQVSNLDYLASITEARCS